jgi:hypothetical protein
MAIDFAGFTAILRRTPWIDLMRCDGCGGYWYVAADTEVADYNVRRLNDREVHDIIDKGLWPRDFDGNPAVWPDRAWLRAEGFESIEDWQARNNPDKTGHNKPSEGTR